MFKSLPLFNCSCSNLIAYLSLSQRSRVIDLKPLLKQESIVWESP